MIQTKSKPYVIPEYSLTGDLLSFLTCRLQYRFYNMGKMPLSEPVQLWFGEFIHGVMEQGFLKWKAGELKFPCEFDDVEPISEEVAHHLEARGLHPNLKIFSYKKKAKRDLTKYLANRRAFESIRIWGPDLYPLISKNEIRLKNMREMKNYQPDINRSQYYTITGVADVITSIDLNKLGDDNKIVKFLKNNERINELIASEEEFEIVVDYKGMSRPLYNNESSSTWIQHRWQIDTYMWLRKMQSQSEGIKTPIIAGVLLYLNELYPSKDDLIDIIEQTKNFDTDVPADDHNIELMSHKKQPEQEYKIERSIRVVPYDEDKIKESLSRFDDVVSEIEECIHNENSSFKNVSKQWSGNEFKRERCVACDLKNICEDYSKEKNENRLCKFD